MKHHLIARLALAILATFACPFPSSAQVTATDFNRSGEVKRRAGDATGAIPDYNKAIELSPNFITAYRNRAMARDALGDSVGAAADRVQVEKLAALARERAEKAGASTSAKSPAKNPSAAATATDYLQSGSTKRLAGDLTGAIADYTKGIELSPSMTLLYLNRGLAHRTNRDADAAIADFSKAIELSPNTHTTPYRNRAALRDALGDSAGAAADRAQADKLDALAVARGEKTGASTPAKSSKKTPPRPAVAAPVDLVARAKEKQARGDLAGALADFDAAIARQPARADLYVERGRVRQANRNFPGAEADFNKAIELDVTFVDAYFWRGSMMNNLGGTAEALADFSKAIALQPTETRGYFARAQISFATGDYAAAIADYDKVIELRPDFDNVYVNRGNAKRLRGDLDGAIADYEQTMRLNPADDLAWLNRGITRKLKGDTTGALADFDHTIELKPGRLAAHTERAHLRIGQRQFDVAIADLDRAIATFPNQPALLNSRGLARKATGDLAGAIVDFTKSIDLSPNGSGEAYKYRGDARAASGDPAGAEADHKRVRLYTSALMVSASFNREPHAAIELIDSAIALEPTNATFFESRGSLLVKRGKLDQALVDLSRAIELDPKLATARLARADARRAKADLAGALADSTVAIELNPKATEAWLARAALHVANSDPTRALGDYSKAIELKPESAETYRTRATVRAANGDASGAEADRRKADELTAAATQQSNLVNAIFEARGRASTKRIAGDFAGARAELVEIIRLKPDDVLGYLQPMEMSLMLDRADDAIADFDKLIARQPTTGGVYWLRGVARQMKGDWEAALADYDRSIASTPTPPAVARFLRCQIARRLGRPESTEPLANATARLDPAWVKLLGGFLDGTVPEAELLARAGQGDATGAAHKKCAAFYHVGMTCLLRGETARAREFFQRCAALQSPPIYNGPADVVAAYVLSRAELARLGPP